MELIIRNWKSNNLHLEFLIVYSMYTDFKIKYNQINIFFVTKRSYFFPLIKNNKLMKQMYIKKLTYERN